MRPAPLPLLLLVTVAGVAPATLPAQSPPVVGPGGANATTASLGWLAGTWRGAVNGGALSAELIFSRPGAGTILGVARISNGPELAVVELISIVDTPTGMQLRFRHFDGDLTAHETDFQQNMAFTAATDSDVTFTNAVPYDRARRSTQPRVTRFVRRGADQFAAHSDIIGSDGNPAVVDVVYQRVK